MKSKNHLSNSIRFIVMLIVALTIVTNCGARKSLKDTKTSSSKTSELLEASTKSSIDSIAKESTTKNVQVAKDITEDKTSVSTNTETSITVVPKDNEPFSVYDFVVNGIAYSGKTNATLVFTTKSTVDSLKTTLKDKSILNAIDHSNKETTVSKNKEANVTASKNTDDKSASTLKATDKKEPVAFNITLALSIIAIIIIIAVIVYLKFKTLNPLTIFKKK